MMIRVWLFALVLYVVACRYHAASRKYIFKNGIIGALRSDLVIFFRR